ncbi:MAG: insulinase family protein [Chitinophagales bacterium]|nr:insulinase family protein [Chitinophagales bacterium]
MPERKQPPPIVDAVHFNLHLRSYRLFTLKNGVKVYAVDAGAEDVMLIEWVFFAGNWFEEQNLIAATTNFLLKNGTFRKNAFQINEYFEYYGSYLNRSCYNETASITLHSLTRHVKELLPAVRELITDSVFPEDELAIYRQNVKQRLKVNLQKSDFVAGRLIDSYLYGKDHPYGKYTSDADFDGLNRESLIRFYNKYYRQGKFIVFAAGKLPQDLESLLNEQFGDLPDEPVLINDIPLDPEKEKKFRIQNDPNSVQGSVRMARPFPNRHHPDFLKAQVLNAVFGGFFGSRLMRNIREDKGYTYGIYSYLQNHVRDSAWMISTEAGRDVCEATINEVYHEMERLKNEPVSEEELKLVRNYLMGAILGELDGPFQIIARWKNIILNDLDENYFYDSVNAIRNVTPEELQQLAIKYLQPEAFYELVVT